MKWYQIALIALGVYVLAALVMRARRNNFIRSGIQDNLCLLIKQLKKYDKEIEELKAERLLVGSNDAKIAAENAKRTAILSLITAITPENPYTIYCAPCDCEKDHADKPGGMTGGDPGPIPTGPNTGGARIGLNVPSGLQGTNGGAY